MGKDEFSFLGYVDAADSSFGNGGAALPVMIMPTRNKKFFFAPNTGVEYEGFWDSVWRQAALALQSSDRVVICGYSMPPADERACGLLDGVQSLSLIHI